MQINLDDIDRDRFYVNPGEVFGRTLYLIKPKQSTMFDWRDDELHLRSLLVDEDGQVVSAGFPKFFNLGERPERDAEIDMAASWVTEKYDGSLIIRSIIDGRVHLRTRGQHGLGDLEEQVMPLVMDHPLVSDPSWAVGRSMLFEYIGPQNRIVLRYTHPELRLLADVDLSTLRIAPFVNDDDGLHESPDTIEAVVTNQRGRKRAEGVVVWTMCQDGWRATKVKTEEYLKLHRLKASLTDDRVRAVCAAENVTSVEEAKAAFGRLGLDWEMLVESEGVILDFIDRRAANREALREVVSKARGDIVKALRAAAEEIGRPDVFHAAIRQSTGGDVQPSLDALDLDMSVGKARSLIESVRL